MTNRTIPPLSPFQILPDVRSMGRQIFDPIWAEKAHTSGTCELIHVIKGAVREEIGRRRFEVGAGQTLLIPGKTRHRDRFEVAAGLDVFMISFTWKAATPYFKVVPPDIIQTLPGAVGAEVHRLLAHLQNDLASGTEADRLVARAHVLTILLLALRHALGARPGRRAADADAARSHRNRQQLMLAAKQYLDMHFAEPISLDGIARALRVSPYHLSHVFSQESDFALFAYLAGIRMRQARDLLRQGRHNVSEVAYAVGYEDSNYFSKVFHRHFGLPPRQLLGRAAG